MAAESAILARPGVAWRIAEATRAALLIDGAAYFTALSSAFAQARRSIAVVGWDIRSSLRLRPERSDETLAQCFVRLLDANPSLEIRVLIWDWVLPMGTDREFLPQWRMAPLHDRLRFVLDNEIPVAASHHEKIVLVDGGLAFVGGIDLTEGRFDTPEHDPKNQHRLPADGGEPPAPFHDVMLAASGPVARAIAELVAERWQRATDEAPIIVPHDVPPPWPEGLAPAFENLPVAIARTRPEHAGQSAAHEILALYHAAIEAAERFIYIENQYLTVPEIATALAVKLRRDRRFELVIITPKACEGALETAVMDSGRKAFVGMLEQAARERVRVLTTRSHGIAVNVHAKLMIVDDRFVTLGSANLANRSMGVDSELNLAIERKEADPVIQDWRHRLLAEHLGSDPETVATTERERGSIIATIDALNDPAAARHVRPLDLAEAALSPFLEPAIGLADPKAPIIPDELFAAALPRDRRRLRRWGGRLLGLAGAGLLLLSWLGPKAPLGALLPAWLALCLGLALCACWGIAERLWRPGLG